MRILTLGDSWTYGSNECGLDPAEISWPAQMAKKYNVEVVNLARRGSSNQRAARIGIEELCRDSNYNYVIFPLAPAARTEVLAYGKWHQVWPVRGHELPQNNLSKLFSEMWHPWNDVQNTMILAFYFMHSVKLLGIPFYVTGLSLMPSLYAAELSWITNYQNNNDFNSLGMPLKELNIGIKDLDRKLKSLKAIHSKNLELQPEYFNDVIKTYLCNSATQKKYGYNCNQFKGHPDDAGFAALADYFAGKIGLI